MIEALIARVADVAAPAAIAGDLLLPAAFVAATSLLIKLFHSPHDVIADLGVCRDASRRKMVFAVSRHNLLRSVDDQPWQWLTSGLGGHKVSALAVSPDYARDETLFAATFGGGVFRSQNGGLGWQACSLGLKQRFIVRLVIARDFSTTGTLFALGLDGIVYRSRNRGEGWQVLPHPWRWSHEAGQEAHRVLLDPMRDAGEAWTACYQPRGASCITCSDRDVLVGTSTGELYASSDTGDTWTLTATVPQGVRITCVVVGPTAMFIGTAGSGVFKRLASRELLEPLASPRELKYVTALAYQHGPGERSRVLATSWKHAVFESDDGGATWARREDGLTRHRQADERRFGAPHFNVLAVEGGDVYVGGFDGLFRARNLAGNWQPIETLTSGIVIDLAVSNPAGGVCAVAASTYGDGLFVDGDNIPRDGIPATRRLGPVRFAPDDAARVLVGSEASVLSFMRGEREWRAASLSPVSRGNRMARLFLHARTIERFAARYLSPRAMGALKRAFQSAALLVGGRVSRVVFPTAIEFSPRYTEDHVIYASTREHGVFRSRDAGRTFRQVWDAGGRFVFALVAIARTQLLLALLPDGVHRSSDGGDNWTPPRTVLPQGQTALVASPAFEADATLFCGGQNGLQVSRDGGETWSNVLLQASAAALFIGGIALSPAFGDDRTMFVHARGVGLFRSTDAGRTFELLSFPSASGEPAFCMPLCFPDSTTLIRFSPRFAEDHSVFAACMEVVYVSRDGGTLLDGI